MLPRKERVSGSECMRSAANARQRAMENEIFRDAVEYGRAKMDGSPRCQRRPVKLICKVLGVSRSNVSARLSRPAMWRDGRQSRQADGASVVEEVRRVVGDLPSYGYRLVWGALRNERVATGRVSMRVHHGVMRTHGLLMRRRPTRPRPARWPWRAATSVGVPMASCSAATTANRCV